MNLHIDHLQLRVPWLPVGDRRRLAELVAGYLASAETPGAPLGADRMSVSVQFREGESLESMAQRIATEMLAALVRTS
jgi:hypothetical protein